MASLETTQSLLVCGNLIADHRETEQLMDRLDADLNGIPEDTLMPSDTRHDILRLLEQLTTGLNTHMACEEEGLFPMLSKHHPMVLMEVEHEENFNLRNQFEAAFWNAEKNYRENKRLKEIGKTWINEQRNHIAREEHGIFPMAERDLSPDEKQQAIRRMESIRGRAKREPIPSISRPERTFQTVEMDLITQFNRPVMVKTLAQNGPLLIKQFTLKAGECIAAHWSPYQIFLFCHEGEVTWSAGSEEVHLKPGQGVVMDPQFKYSIYADTNCQLLVNMQEC
jgi:hemerythrin-like domain-containing protein/quercetin dioxygenase-like cupin family protein